MLLLFISGTMAPSTAFIAAASAGAGIVAGWFLRAFLRSSVRGATHLNRQSRSSSLASADSGEWEDIDEVCS